MDENNFRQHLKDAKIIVSKWPKWKQNILGEVICPCIFTKPCSENCTCSNSFLSGGCSRCSSFRANEDERNEAIENAIDILENIHTGDDFECEAWKAAEQLKKAFPVS